MAESGAVPMDRPSDVLASLGRVGIWTFALDRQPAPEAREFVADVESLGFRALWIPEGLGSKEAFAHAAVLLASSQRLNVATGIASIWARDAVAMANGARTIGDAYPGRFVMGIGVSHESSVTRRGEVYRQPLTRMREYLEAMASAPHACPDPERPVPVLLAALGPKMLELTAEHTAGAHTYFVPPEHTEVAREVMGPGPFLSPEQAVVLETDPDRARRIARKYMSGYIELPNYANNLLRLGWSADDLSDGGTDKLVDAIVAWGDVDAIAARVQSHLDAGADHVSVQPLGERSADLPTGQLRALAPALVP
jgi:probable F420-dependent oxidoreductase